MDRLGRIGGGYDGGQKDREEDLWIGEEYGILEIQEGGQVVVVEDLYGDVVVIKEC